MPDPSEVVTTKQLEALAGPADAPKPCPAALIGIRKLGRTYRAPAIPYVTRWDDDDDRVERLRAAIFNAFTDQHLTTTRQALYLKNIEVLPVSAYRRISAFEDYAARLDYPKLR